MAKYNSEIEAEIRKALGDDFDVKADEKPHQYRARLVRAVNQFKDKQWEALSEPAQKWANLGIKELKNKEEVSQFADYTKPKGEDKADDKGKGEDKKPKGEKRERVSDGDSDASSDADSDADSDASSDADSDAGSDGDKDKKEEKKSSKKDKKDDDKKADKPKRAGDGVCEKAREIICKHPKYTMAEVHAALEKKGLKLADASMRTLFYGVRGAMETLKRLEMLKAAD